MYGRIVLNMEAIDFDEPFEKAKHDVGTANDAAVPADVLRELCDTYKGAVKEYTGKPFPQDPYKQLRGAVEAVFQSWNGARAIAYRDPRTHQPRSRHRGQRAGHGVRQS